MLKTLFSRRKNEEKGGGAVAPTLQNHEAFEQPENEFQLLSLHRGNFTMTPELLRRREEEALRKKYNLPPSKTGGFI